MKYSIEFHINYRAAEGETLCAEIFERTKPSKAIITLPLARHDGDEWSAKADADLNARKKYTYIYCVVRDGEVVAEEKAFPARELPTSADGTPLAVFDLWRWDTHQLNLDSSALKYCVFGARGGKHAAPPTDGGAYATLHALLPQGDNCEIRLVGEAAALGAWDAANGIALKRSGIYDYFAALPDTASLQGTQYKYVVRSKKSGAIVWEDGANRIFSALPASGAVRVNDGWVRIARHSDWRGAGMVIPLFSLASEGSAGVGDFGDFKRLISWAAGVGFSAIQLLPVNDTVTLGTWRDSYPYNAISVCAISSIYIDLRPLIAKYLPAEKEGYDCRCKKLNAIGSVDFERALKYKTKMLKALFAAAGRDVLAQSACRAFVEAHRDWLVPYAAFCVLRDKYKTVDFTKFERHAAYDEAAILADKVLARKMEYYYFVQFLAFSQMEEAHKLAKKLGVILKGDIPIGVNVNSADVWAAPELFNRDMSTGAPPDYFSRDGQNWGFPTYNWEAMSRDGYSWWKKRFKIMAQCFDAFRIDHVLGFFRIWEIPRGERSAKKGHFSPALPLSVKEIEGYGFQLHDEYIGTLFLRDKNDASLLHVAIDAHDEPAYHALDEGARNAFNALYYDFFFRRHDDFWARGANEKLAAVTNATDMLPCAEDLGMLPGNVGEVLERQKILSLEIQNMPKTNGVEFADTARNPYRSVATISTHDMPSFRLWWSKFGDTARRYASTVLGIHDAPAEADAAICERVVRNHLASPSMLCLLSFQDWTAMCPSTRAADITAEQINDPSNPDQYWRYKMHLTIEQLEQNREFADMIRGLLAATERNLFCHGLVE